MTNGVDVSVKELIGLKRYARKLVYQPKHVAIMAGHYLSKIRGRGMDFSEVRNYQPGDEIRHMEWRVTARTGRPHVKLYQEERERPVIFLIDFNASMYFGTRVAFKSVVAARLAALIAWTAIKHGDRVGALIYGQGHQEFMPKTRETAILPIFASLEYFSRQYKKQRESAKFMGMTEALTRLRRVARPGSLIVIISDFFNLEKQSTDQIQRLKEHNDIIAYEICDPLELHAPPANLYSMTDGQQTLLLDTYQTKSKQSYQLWCDNRQEQLNQFFSYLQIQWVTVTGETDLAYLVHQTFPRRKDG